ncbi:uncharacterized protein BT62DRAFT_889253 [Guyanagaster necrorhizus]|uniref:AA9 family lytic polysaccharide monooxygenase n=1 Tax=Guyanagaster necrorhizus TaxID=856835 RepID=A0A9P8AW45_9AGAR|nr:uncharacterized protein BT62DRAFT_889253 [Guyanagaster necrorhizus MCA 3950]KAG7448567.1 hypothetical protein BT62DRAFT_889253 [Guyanagaster necrorhizus MCA 3950]
MLFTLATAVSLVTSVVVHAMWQEFWIGDVDAGSSCVRLPVSNFPMTDFFTTGIACNVAVIASTGLLSGDAVTVEMHQQPNDRSCVNEAIGGNHYGLVYVYMAAVDDATTAVGSEAAWFKVSESGLVSNNLDFFVSVDLMQDNCGHYTFNIPADIARGNYLFRAIGNAYLLVALHVAAAEGGAQDVYILLCSRWIPIMLFSLPVGGSGTVTPDAVNLPGACSTEDPGILINVYTQLNSYIVPGPTLYGTTEAAVATLLETLLPSPRPSYYSSYIVEVALGS